MDAEVKDEVRAAYWRGYAAGLADRAAPRNPRGWIFMAAVAACLLLWLFLAAVLVKLT